MPQRVLEHPKASPAWGSAVAEIVDYTQRNVAGVKLMNLRAGGVTEVPSKGIVVAVGHQPNTPVRQRRAHR